MKKSHWKTYVAFSAAFAVSAALNLHNAENFDMAETVAKLEKDELVNKYCTGPSNGSQNEETLQQIFADCKPSNVKAEQRLYSHQSGVITGGLFSLGWGAAAAVSFYRRRSADQKMELK